MNNALTPEVLAALSTVSLQCVECSAVYPGLEAGSTFRYRCNCGGILDVEMKFALPEARQLFDERASTFPNWPVSAGRKLLDYSGVWRYRELILPVPEQYIISRPEGNTGLYPVGVENCGPGRMGHRQIGLYAGLEQLFLKHEGENPTGSFKDRGMTVGVTMANLYGAQAVACASTGNTSASLASYAAQAGMRAIVFLPAGNVA
jgi:threonine synthase